MRRKIAFTSAAILGAVAAATTGVAPFVGVVWMT